MGASHKDLAGFDEYIDGTYGVREFEPNPHHALLTVFDALRLTSFDVKRIRLCSGHTKDLYNFWLQVNTVAWTKPALVARIRLLPN